MKPKMHRLDVVVCGGGPSGVAAAISAARAGATVALIEATGCLGGMATNGLVPVFNPFSNGKYAVIRGIGWEVVRRLRARGSALLKPDPMPREIPKYDWTGLDAEKLKALLDEMVVEAKVAVCYFTQVTEPVVRSGRILGVWTWSKSALEQWRAKTFVDCTGDADVAARAGCPYEGQKSSLSPFSPPQGPLQAQMDLALKPQWGNTAQNVVQIRVPAGTTIYEGFAAPQGGLLGGGSQVYIPKVDPAWVVKP